MIFYEMGNFTFRYCQLTTARRNPNFITVTLHLNNKRLRNTHGYYLETARTALPNLFIPLLAKAAYNYDRNCIYFRATLYTYLDGPFNINNELH